MSTSKKLTNNLKNRGRDSLHTCTTRKKESLTNWICGCDLVGPTRTVANVAYNFSTTCSQERDSNDLHSKQTRLWRLTICRTIEFNTAILQISNSSPADMPSYVSWALLIRFPPSFIKSSLISWRSVISPFPEKKSQLSVNKCCSVEILSSFISPVLARKRYHSVRTWEFMA